MPKKHRKTLFTQSTVIFKFSLKVSPRPSKLVLNPAHEKVLFFVGSGKCFDAKNTSKNTVVDVNSCSRAVRVQQLGKFKYIGNANVIPHSLPRSDGFLVPFWKMKTQRACPCIAGFLFIHIYIYIYLRTCLFQRADVL